MHGKRSAGMAAPYCQRKDLASDWLSPPFPTPPLCTTPSPSSPLPEFIVCKTVGDCLECASLQNLSFVVYSDGRFGGFLTVKFNFPPSTPSLPLPLSLCNSSFSEVCCCFLIQFKYSWSKFPHDIRMLNGNVVGKKKKKKTYANLSHLLPSYHCPLLFYDEKSLFVLLIIFVPEECRSFLVYWKCYRYDGAPAPPVSVWLRW